MTSPFDIGHARDYLKMIQAVDRLEYNGNVSTVMQKLKLQFLNGLAANVTNNNWVTDDRFLYELFETALYICGGDTESVVSFRDIEMLQQISNAVPDTALPRKIRQQIIDRKKEILEELFREIPLREKNAYVGIYGIGRDAERFFDVYQKSLGRIKARVAFIDSSAISGQGKYKGYDIYNVNDIGNMPLECIVVASSKYEREMCRTIARKYENRFRIIRLRSDLKF